MIQSARLRISTPTEPISPGRGFYQLEEDALYIQIGLFDPDRRFFSYLESASVGLEFDRSARLIFIEVNQPRRFWEVEDSLAMPVAAEVKDIRWLDFRETIAEPQLTCNSLRTLLRLRFHNGRPWRNYYLADHVIMQVDEQDRLSAIWTDEIEDDLAGREIASFRKRCRRLRSHAG